MNYQVQSHGDHILASLSKVFEYASEFGVEGENEKKKHTQF